MDIEHITAAEFLELKANTERNGPDKPILRNALAAIKHLPQTQERLAFGLLAMTLDAIEAQRSPRILVVQALYFASGIRTENMPNYVAEIDRIAFGGFERLGTEGIEGGDYTAYDLTLRSDLVALRRADPNRYAATFNCLKGKIAHPDKDSRTAILNRVEKKANGT